ncbi:MAG TPA: ABC transporter ATP-binding protein [Vicinamibacterales bacterium]|jgi:ABC-type multidrug transport system ATPase subunit|nr:ABC transporter ATP-binding protein [Vicinamibacterales bacterium]
MTHAIHVERLVKRYGGVTALDGVSFDVEPRELFGFIGPDGAGKTTLFRILATLVLPDAGTARVLGLDPVRDLWALRPRIGYMAGRFSLYPDLSVEENVRFFAAVFGTTLEREHDQIAPIYSQLEPFRDRRAAALSGGMKQKLALCCALVHRPELLLLDEPTTGVDAVSRREFWDLLGRLKEQGLTIVVSTPYMDEAKRCDRVALVQRGRILAIDTPDDVTRSFEGALLAVHVHDRYGALLALRRYPHAATIYPFGETLHYTDARKTAGADVVSLEVVEFLRANGFADARVQEIPATVEDTFMARMGAAGEVA